MALVPDIVMVAERDKLAERQFDSAISRYRGSLIRLAIQSNIGNGRLRDLLSIIRRTIVD